MASEEDKQKAHELIAEYADFNNMGQLRSAITTAITAARAETWKEAISAIRRRQTQITDPDYQAITTCGFNEAVESLEAAAGSKTKVFSEDEQKNQGR